ncbi:hypothetical protein F4809DRAFT_652900 [Biscogniauxia mediterranea]|nr:hypothetical protein F4809DRAFT_652900 [Biscogniauxia mediterranea]
MSSSILSSGNAPAQRVPAWKRLGLKLKPASEEQGQHIAAPHSDTTSTSAPARVRGAKRKSLGAPALEQSAKRAKQDNSHGPSSVQAPKKPKAKSVSFAADAAETRPPARANGTRPTNKQSKPSPKKAVAPSPKPIKHAPVNLEPALAYLRLWHTSREAWKFNKNHQTRLLEQVFADETTIPAADISVFYEYISGLKGAVRTRLRELANGIKAQDLEQGPDGFPGAKEGTKAMAEKKQAEYEAVIKGFLDKERTPEKRRFEEVEYVLRTTDMEMQRRVVKRMRAEMVLDELAGGEDAEATTSAEKGGSSSKDAQQSASGHAAAVAVAGEGPEGDKRLKLNDGSQQRVKRKRKVRTAAVEDDTSSESESDSESESESDSSSGSGSSSSCDSENEAAAPSSARNGADSSSSSSSSSSESSESESESDSSSSSEDDD